MIAAVPTGAWLPWLGALIFVAACVGYIGAAARGQARPSRVTWGVWTVTAGIAVAAAWSAGAAVSALLVTAAASAIPAAVIAATFVAALRGRGVAVDPPTPGQRRVDRVCLACSAATLAAWAVTDNPTVALILITATDAVAALPTGRRAWHGEEAYGPYLGGAAAAVCTLLTLTSWALPDWLFAVYFLGLCVTLCGLIAARRAVVVEETRQPTPDPLAWPPPGLRPPPERTTERVEPPWARSPHADALVRFIPHELRWGRDGDRVAALIRAAYGAGHEAGFGVRERLAPRTPTGQLPMSTYRVAGPDTRRVGGAVGLAVPAPSPPRGAA